MPTIKDVAAAAGVSPTTVSLVINGHGEQHRIPQTTIERIYAAVRELGYQPNLSARRLRNSSERKPVIAFFWPLDYRANMMGYMMSLIQNTLIERHFDCELVVHPYINGRIEEACSGLIQNSYSGAIIGAASESDVRHLEDLNTQVSIVLLNRESNKYNTAVCNSNKIGLLAASLLRQKNINQTALICTEQHYVATSRRTDAFIYACQQLRVEVPEAWRFSGTNTLEGGALAAEALCAQNPRPRMLVCESDTMVPGILYTLHKYGIRVPEDMELLSFATQASDTMKYLVPSVSTISMPNEIVVPQAVSILIAQMESNNPEPTHAESEAKVELRESFSL